MKTPPPPPLIPSALLCLTLAGCGGGSGGGTGGIPLDGLTSSNQLATIDATTAQTAVRTGPGGSGHQLLSPTLALDSVKNQLYLMSDVQLIRTPAAGGPQGLTQAPTAVADLPFPNTPACIALDSATGALYGVVHSGPTLFKVGTLVRIDTATGVVEQIGACEPVDDLTFDTLSGDLFGLRDGSFQRIDSDTGASVELFQEVDFLPDVSGLTADPVTGLFYTARQAIGLDPQLLRLSISGSIQVIRTLERPLDEVEIDADSGVLFGLTRDQALVGLGTLFDPAWNELGNVACRPTAMAYDPLDGGHFAVNLATDLTETLVKLHPAGGIRTIGALDGDIGSIAFDPVTRELWGNDRDADLVAIDITTAATTPIPGLTLTAWTRLALDPATGDFYGYDDQAEVTVLIDPVAQTKTLLSNAIGVEGVGALVFDSFSGRLIANTTSFGGGGQDLRGWAPVNSGLAQGLAQLTYVPWSFAETDEPGVLRAFTDFGSSGAELFRLSPDTNGERRSEKSLWNRAWRAAVRVEGEPRGFAIDADSIYAFDLVTGETERLGSHPGPDGATGLTYDPEQGLLGFLDGDEIRWSTLSTPFFEQSSTSLTTSDLDEIARDPASGLYYATSPTALHTVAVNEGGNSVVQQIASLPAGVQVADLAFHGGALQLATQDQRLFRFDTTSNSFTLVGRTAFVLDALY